MISDTFSKTSTRARVAALTLAFGVVAGGAALAVSPSFASPDEPIETVAADGVAVSAAESLLAPDADIVLSGSGFTPGALVYAQVTDPSGFTNFSYGSAPATAAEDGSVAAVLAAPADGWEPGEYAVGLYESDALTGSASVTVQAAPGETAEPTESPSTTPGESESPSGSETPTADASTAPTADAEPTETSDATATPAAPTLTPVEAPADDAAAPAPGVEAPTASATPTAEQPAGAPWAKPAQADIPIAQASADGVVYTFGGFAAKAELELILTLPDGSVVHVDAGEKIVPDGSAEQSASITNSGAWQTGRYTALLQTKSSSEGEAIPASELQSASFDFTIVGDGGSVSSGFGDRGGSLGGTTTGGQLGTGSGLASTGADAFGPIGLALGTLIGGAGITILGRRFIAGSAE